MWRSKNVIDNQLSYEGEGKVRRYRDRRYLHTVKGLQQCGFVFSFEELSNNSRTNLALIYIAAINAQAKNK